MRNLLYSLTLVCLISSCGFYSELVYMDIQKLSLGMTPEEVMDIMGDSYEIIAVASDLIVWEYEATEHTIYKLYFVEGVLMEWEKERLTHHPQPCIPPPCIPFPAPCPPPQLIVVEQPIHLPKTKTYPRKVENPARPTQSHSRNTERSTHPSRPRTDNVRQPSRPSQPKQQNTTPTSRPSQPRTNDTERSTRPSQSRSNSVEQSSRSPQSRSSSAG